MFVYLITDATNSKCYVGTAVKSVAGRYSDHWSRALRHQDKSPLHAAMRQKGAAAFSVVMLATCDDYEQMLQRERAEIAARRTLIPSGYNLVKGGRGNFGWKPRVETRAAISRSRLGVAPWNKGKRMSVAFRKKNSESQLIASAHRKAAGIVCVAWNKGVPATAATRRKLSLMRKGRKYTETERLAHAGVKFSAASCAKLSAIRKQWWSSLSSEAREAHIQKLHAGLRNRSQQAERVSV